jgi:hypothetical protein
LEEEVFIDMLCGQALTCICVLGGETSFSLYQIEGLPEDDPVQGETLNYQPRRVKGGDADDLEAHPHLAIPSPLAFNTLFHIKTDMKDAIPVEIKDFGSQKRQEILVQSGKDHARRIAAKLLNRTLSRMKSISTKDFGQVVKAPDDVKNAGDGDSHVSASDDLPAYKIVHWTVMKLCPQPGFVIKTRHLDDSEGIKVFINVYHHSAIENVLRQAKLSQEILLDPFIVYGSVGFVPDKSGVMSKLYHIALSSTFFIGSFATSENKITGPFYVSKVSNFRFSCHFVSIFLVI